ncbi:hypothetical protein [Domibacillus tundrae]
MIDSFHYEHTTLHKKILLKQKIPLEWTGFFAHGPDSLDERPN